ncbi:MAG: alkaline phosphatase family protein, partial [bacterium]|nr:alkaline phosphatase family protein [bacterium]
MFILNLNESLINTFIDEAIQHLTYKFNVFNYLQERLNPDFSFIHEFGNDQISHALWHIIEPDMGDYDPEMIERLREKVSSYYKMFDNYIGILMERMKENDTLLIMSDHGFGRWHKTIALNTWLLKNGFIKLKNRWVTKLRYKLWQKGITHAWLFKNIVKRLANWGLRAHQRPIGEEFYRMQSRKDFLLTVRDIDWSKSVAFSTTGWGQIYINSHEKFITGCVKTKEEYAKVYKEITEALAKMEDPDSGPINGQIWDKHSLYNGPHVEHAPDITFSALEKGYLATNLYGFITNEPVGERWVFTGTHRQKGILIGTGPYLRKTNERIEMDLQDFLPNILYMNKLPIPVDIDGKVINNLYTEEFINGNQPVYKGSSVLKKKGLKKVFSKSEEEKIEDTLKGLGYL